MKRNLNFIAVALFAVGCCFSAMAQEYKDFDLSTYKLPDIVRNELDFSLSSSGSFSDRNAKELDAFNIDGKLQTNFNRYKNTAAFKGWHNVEVEVGGKYLGNGEDKKESNYLFSLYYANVSRFYNDKQIYFGTGGSFNLSTEGAKNSQATGKYKRTYVGGSVPLVVGKGRLEEVKDARQAIYILDNLSKRGVLKRKLSNQEITELAELISIVKNKRFLDSRLRMIDEITAVDSFFIKNNLLEKTGAVYFTTLYDYWMYGDRFSRLSGTEIEGGFEPGFQYENAPDNYIEKRVMPTISAYVGITYEKPVNLYWQRSGYAALRGGYLMNNIHYGNNTINKVDQYDLSLMGSYAWGYYPTSRTNINFGVSEYASWLKNQERGDYNNLVSRISSSSKAFVELYYYFSPQLRLSVDAGLYFNYTHEIEQKKDNFHLNGQFMATLTYSLF